MKINQNVLEVLSQLEISADEVRIATQLDRKLYTEVNKVLEACGGKWTRKAKAHVFPDGKHVGPLIDTVLATGEVRTAREDGFFPTPDQLAERLVELVDVKSGDRVLEPSAGIGNLVVPCLRRRASVVVAIERDRERRDRLSTIDSLRLTVLPDVTDFMLFRWSHRPFDKVVMNPPFFKVGEGDHIDHFRHAFSMLKIGGRIGCIMPSSVEFRQDKRHVVFRDWVHDHGNFFEVPQGSFKASGTMVNSTIVIVDRAA